MLYAITENGRPAMIEEIKFNNINAKNKLLITWPQTNVTCYHVTIANKEIPLERNFGVLMGLYIGDGWVDKNLSCPKIHIATIDDNLVCAYRELVNKYFRGGHLRGYTIKPTAHNYYPEYTSYHGKFSIPIPFEIRDAIIPLLGHGAYHKHIPDIFLSSPEEFRWGLLSGLIDTDGSISCRPIMKKGKIQQNKNVMYATQSWELAMGVQKLCMSLGVCASITITDRKGRYELNVVLGSMDIYALRHMLSCVSGKNKILDTFTFGAQDNPKDILPFDKEIKNLIQPHYSTNPQRGVLLNRTVNAGYILRGTFVRIATEHAIKAMDDKYGMQYRWERVLEIVPMPNDHTGHDLVSKIKEVKAYAKKAI